MDGFSSFGTKLADGTIGTFSTVIGDATAAGGGATSPAAEIDSSSSTIVGPTSGYRNSLTNIGAYDHHGISLNFGHNSADYNGDPAGYGVGGGGGGSALDGGGPPSPCSSESVCILNGSEGASFTIADGPNGGLLSSVSPSPVPPLPTSGGGAASGGGGDYKMGYFSATSYVIGNIIGSGIFVTPASILRYTESVGLSLIVWLLCAVIALLGSLCYIELGTSIREAGCDFAYICYVKWYSVAFSFMWVSVLMTYPATIAINAETFGQYLVEGLRQSYAIDDHWEPIAQKLFGIVLLFLVTWMNFFALGKFAARFQIAATAAKLLACGLIIGTGFYYYAFRGWNAALAEPMRNSNTNAGELMMALYGGLYAYSGWDILNYGTGEIQKPKRNMPLALLSGIFTVSAVYFSINLAYFAVLDVETVKSSNAVAALFSQRTLGGFSYAIPFLIGILLIGSLNSNLFSGSRYMYAAARQGHLPSCFSCVNVATDSPRVAIAAQSALAIAISFVGDLDALIGYVMFGFWAQRVFTLCALLTIRYRKIPVHAEAIRVPLSCIYLFLAINVGLVIIPIVKEFAITAFGICICAVGFAFYFLFIYPNYTSPTLTAMNEWTTLVAAIVFDALPDLKRSGASLPTAPLLVSSESSQQLLQDGSSSFGGRLTADADSVPDLHSDEKNTLIRNSSNTGLRMW